MSLSATISGVEYGVYETTLKIAHQVDQQDSFSFDILDTSGTAIFSKFQPVVVTDSTLGTLITGIIQSPKMTLQWPSAQKRWSLTCIDQTYRLSKRTSNKIYTNQFAGTIAADQIQRYAAAENVSGAFALQWNELEADWQQGTLSNVVAATNATTGNVGAGDLELALSGSRVTITGHGAGFSLMNGLMLTGYASSGYSSAFTNRQIWSGSQALHTNDTFLYDVWIASTSPAIKAGCDFICSDGTIFSTIATQDKQFLSPLTSTDLSGLANDQWYTRAFLIPSGLNGKTLTSVTVGFNSAAAGTYTAYFRRIEYQLSGGGTVTFFGDASTLQSNVQVSNIGYTSVNLTQVQVQDKNAVVGHASLSIDAATIVQGSQMSWTSSLPSGATAIRETSIDNGATWQQITSGSAVPNLLAGMVVAGRSIQYRDTLMVGTDPTASIGLGGPTLIVNSAPQSTKTDSITSYTTTADFNSGTLTNLITTGTNGITLNGFQRNWDDGLFGNQPLFGATSPFQQVENKQMVLSCGASSDVRSRLDFAGQWQNFICECDIVVVSTASGNTGIAYRTTNWNNGNNTFGYVVSWSTTQIQLGYGSDSGSSGTYTNLATTSVSITANSIHRMKLVINGSTHQVYLDNVLLINKVDSTYNSSSYLALRLFNGSSSTLSTSFDNFGVCASLSGTWQSPAINIAGPGTYGNAAIFWDVDGIPDSTCSITGQTSIDGGSTFQSVTNGGAISGLTSGQSLTGKTLILKLTLAANNAPVVPVLNGVTAWILGQYSSTGTRSTAPLAWDNMTRGNVVGGFGTATNGASYTKTGTGLVALTSDEATISNTTGDVHMQLGSTTQQDTDGTVRFSLSASTISAGMELRYSNANTFYRLQASTTTISIIKKAGPTVTLASVAMALSTGVFYHMRFIVHGSGTSGPLNLYGNIWADGSTEPAAFTISATD